MAEVSTPQVRVLVKRIVRREEITLTALDRSRSSSPSSKGKK